MTHRPSSSAALVLITALGLAACGSATPDAARLQPAPKLLLLGEVHDNASGHAMRLQALTERVRQGARPALLMEQFDREQQREIDRLQPAPPGMWPGDTEIDLTVDALVKLGNQTPGGWNWAFYRPYLQLALRNRMPIVAANVSRNDARAVMQQGLAARGFSDQVPADILAVHVDDIVRSHCGMITPAQAGPMALAQVARDQFMAQQMEAHAQRGVVLLAGNGHVRKDVGVPRWLDAGSRGRSLAIAYLESDGEADAAFDEVIAVPAQPRGDPCDGMRAPVAAPPAATAASSPVKPPKQLGLGAASRPMAQSLAPEPTSSAAS
jgi:uncharacterized iron-regulated protein